MLRVYEREAELDPAADRTVDELLEITALARGIPGNPERGAIFLLESRTDSEPWGVSALIPTGDPGLEAQGYPWTFAWLWVAPEARGLVETPGLLTEAIRWARERGAPGLRTLILARNVESSDRARRAGFRPFRTEWLLDLDPSRRAFWNRK